jgi:putative membrane protein
MADRLLTGAIAAPLAQMTGSDGGMGWGIAMMVAMLLVVVLVVVGVIWLVRSLLRERAGRDRDDSGPPDALRVLERRFAEGEIEIDEYRERRSILERGR